MTLDFKKVEDLTEQLKEKSKWHLDNQARKRKIISIALNKRAKGDMRDMDILKKEAEQELDTSLRE